MKTRATIIAALALSALCGALAQAGQTATPARRQSATGGQGNAQGTKTQGAAAQSPKQAGRPPLKARPSGDAAIIRTLADAMGFVRGLGRGETTNTLNRLQWFGTGTMVDNNQQYRVTKYSYAMTLSLNGAREDIQRQTTGGRQERIVRAYLGQDAWNEKTPGVDATPAANQAKARRLQFLRTPFGFTKALLQTPTPPAKVADPGPGGRVTIDVTLEGVPITATLDADYRPASIAMTVDGRNIVTKYAQYRDLAEYGVMFPTRVTETVDGRPTLNLTIDDGRVASYLILQSPSGSGT